MNDNNPRDREVRDYVRNRLAADTPPTLTEDIMNQVHRTEQRRRGLAWPVFTGLVTVAAAVVVAVIGIGLVDRANDGIGTGPSPSPTVAPSDVTSATPQPSVSEEASQSPSAEPTATDGEFGPVHSMAPEEAFDNGQGCEVADVFDAEGQATGIGWSISFPDGWHTNAEAERRSACTLFAAEAFDINADGTYPESVAIVADVPPGGDFGPGGEVVRTDEYTVDGLAAIRYEIAPAEGGFVMDPSVVWIIAIDGNLPAEGNDRPYLVLSTHSSDADELATRVDVLDRMVATLDVRD